MAGIVRTFIRKEVEPFKFGSDGPTIGQAVDAAIVQALERRDALQSIAVEISEEEWHALLQDFGYAGKETATRKAR